MAAASALFFVLSELPGASKERISQLLAAALIMAIFAAVHTHTVLGTKLRGWRWYQPFHGGTCFVVLQICGWTCLGVVAFAVAMIMISAAYVQGLRITLGMVQLVAQLVLVLSLGYFENVSEDLRAWKGKVANWKMDGVPIILIAFVMGALFVGGAAAAMFNPPAPGMVGWLLVGLVVATKTAGLHMMWTVTWNILSIASLLIGSKDCVAIAAVMGVVSICAPWYLARVIYIRYDYPHRALCGLSKWASDELFGPFNMRGWYLHEASLFKARFAFWLLDTSLHVLPTLYFLQKAAAMIRPVHVGGSCVVTAAWGITLSMHYNIIDWNKLWNGRFSLYRWGGRSPYEPQKVAHIYQFTNPIYPDNSFDDSFTGFVVIMLVSHATVAWIAMQTWSAEAFSTLGGAHLISMKSLCIAIGLCFSGGMLGACGATLDLFRYRSGKLDKKIA